MERRESAFKTFNYVIDYIIAKRVKSNGIVEYLVKWEGYGESDSTWEPINNFASLNVIDEFESCLRRQLGFHDDFLFSRPSKTIEELLSDGDSKRRSDKSLSKNNGKCKNKRKPNKFQKEILRKMEETERLMKVKEEEEEAKKREKMRDERENDPPEDGNGVNVKMKLKRLAFRKFAQYEPKPVNNIQNIEINDV